MAIPTELGPVEYVVVEFENGQFDGSGLQELARLQDEGIIRVLDLMFISKDADGGVQWLDYDGLTEAGAELGVISADQLALLSEGDAQELAADLEPGDAIAVLVFEDTWALRLQQAVGKAGGRLAEASRVPREAIEAALAYAGEIEQQEASA